MGSISYRPRNPALATGFDSGFNEFRYAFYDRLDEERLQLLTLGAALAGSRAGNARVIDHLALRAHRLQGRAEIFEVAAVAQAANALERAAMRAMTRGAVQDDLALQSALAALVQLISTIESDSRNKSNAAW
jgi:hypothetical protein